MSDHRPTLGSTQRGLNFEGRGIYSLRQLFRDETYLVYVRGSQHFKGVFQFFKPRRGNRLHLNDQEPLEASCDPNGLSCDVI